MQRNNTNKTIHHQSKETKTEKRTNIQNHDLILPLMMKEVLKDLVLGKINFYKLILMRKTNLMTLNQIIDQEQNNKKGECKGEEIFRNSSFPWIQVNSILVNQTNELEVIYGRVSTCSICFLKQVVHIVSYQPKLCDIVCDILCGNHHE